MLAFPYTRLLLGIVVTTSLLMANTVHSQKSVTAPAGSPTVKNRRHSATLKWAPSPSAATDRNLRYVIYRTDGSRDSNGTPQCGSAFKKISELKAPATSYADKSVKAGHIYCYKVSAATSHAESPSAGLVVAVIPEDTLK